MDIEKVILTDEQITSFRILLRSILDNYLEPIHKRYKQDNPMALAVYGSWQCEIVYLFCLFELAGSVSPDFKAHFCAIDFLRIRDEIGEKFADDPLVKPRWEAVCEFINSLGEQVGLPWHYSPNHYITTVVLSDIEIEIYLPTWSLYKPTDVKFVRQPSSIEDAYFMDFA